MHIRRLIAALLCLSMAPIPGGCTGGGEAPASLDPSGVFTPVPATGDSAAGATKHDDVLPGSEGWAILLESFPGRQELAAARSRLPYVARQLNRSDVSIRAVNHGYAIVLGSYENSTSEAARTDLEWVTGLTSGGRRPYAAAWLVPPPSAVVEGNRPEMNLAFQRRVWPQAAYTLQVEVWQAPEGASASQLERFRRTAEERAFEIRRQGDPAYYYHGNRLSMVTVGLFTQEDYRDDGGVASVRSPLLRDLMDRYPLNLMNGMELLEKRREGGRSVTRRQRSMLVRVPE